MEKKVDVRDRYSRELEEIRYILQNLKNGRVYELPGGSKGDGSLEHNATKLEKLIKDLVLKIEYDKDSINDELHEAFFKMEDNK